MKRFKIDGAKLLEFYGQDVELQRVFFDIEKELKAQGLVVCRYVVNGIALDEKHEERFAHYLISEVSTLEYLTEDETKLAAGVLQGWLDALPELQAGAEELGEKIRQGHHNGYLRDLRDIIENCEYLATSLKSFLPQLPKVHKEIEKLVCEIEEKTMAVLREAMVHVEKKDMMQLSWTLEYDVVHCLEIWKDTLLRVKSENNRANNTGQIGEKLIDDHAAEQTQNHLVRSGTTH